MLNGRTLVTGATGFAGTHLLDLLCRAHTAPIDAWSRPGGHPAKPVASVRWQPVNLLDADSVASAIAEHPPTEIYHLAGTAHVGASWERSTSHLETHVLGTHHLLEALRAHAPKCRTLVVTSGMIYKPQDHPVGEDAALGPASPYALSKLAEDELARHVAVHDQLDIVIARPFNHIGPGQSPDFAASSFAYQIAAIEAGAEPATIHVGNLSTTRDLTDVRDVVAAYVALMRAGRRAEAYNVCRGEAVLMRDLLDRLLALSSARVTCTEDPSKLRPNDTAFVAGNADKLRAETGWTPQIPLQQTFTDILDFWRRALANRR
jgi:GDP-4-dehydro-6-deoxy-D-mannose reductase